MEELCECLTDETFQGRNDPALLLWHHLISPIENKDRAAAWEDTYRRTVTAVRAFCEGRTLTYMRPSSTDLFSWEKDFSIPQIKTSTAPVREPALKVKEQFPLLKELPATDELPMNKKREKGRCDCGNLAFVILPNGDSQCGECYIGGFKKQESTV